MTYEETFLHVKNINITPSQNEQFVIQKELITKDYMYAIRGHLEIMRVVDSVNFTISGITADGQNVEITFHDPKDLEVKYD